MNLHLSLPSPSQTCERRSPHLCSSLSRTPPTPCTSSCALVFLLCQNIFHISGHSCACSWNWKKVFVQRSKTSFCLDGTNQRGSDCQHSKKKNMFGISRHWNFQGLKFPGTEISRHWNFQPLKLPTTEIFRHWNLVMWCLTLLSLNARAYKKLWEKCPHILSLGNKDFPIGDKSRKLIKVKVYIFRECAGR